MFRRQARQYHPGHLGRVDSGNRVLLDVALPGQPVAECPDRSVIPVLAVVTVEVDQEAVDVSVSEIIAGNEWPKTTLVEFQRPC